MSKYTCHSDNHGPAHRKTVYRAHEWAGDVEIIETRWFEVRCGHITSESDPQCSGCKFRGGWDAQDS
ncbi:hypothetical protein D6779_09900 [Candidatus Parcubacteria bacterium]|nr:MAG: hypothetical protein D6779_09900 [Candidatus Parcubacteria bacterium]